jgi:hypothetical protein
MARLIVEAATLAPWCSLCTELTVALERRGVVLLELLPQSPTLLEVSQDGGRASRRRLWSQIRAFPSTSEVATYGSYTETPKVLTASLRGIPRSTAASTLGLEILWSRRSWLQCPTRSAISQGALIFGYPTWRQALGSHLPHGRRRTGYWGLQQELAPLVYTAQRVPGCPTKTTGVPNKLCHTGSLVSPQKFPQMH